MTSTGTVPRAWGPASQNVCRIAMRNDSNRASPNGYEDLFHEESPGVVTSAVSIVS